MLLYILYKTLEIYCLAIAGVRPALAQLQRAFMKRRLVTPTERYQRAKQSVISVCQPMHNNRPVLQSLARALEGQRHVVTSQLPHPPLFHAICPLAYILNTARPFNQMLGRFFVILTWWINSASPLSHHWYIHTFITHCDSIVSLSVSSRLIRSFSWSLSIIG